MAELISFKHPNLSHRYRASAGSLVVCVDQVSVETDRLIAVFDAVKAMASAFPEPQQEQYLADCASLQSSLANAVDQLSGLRHLLSIIRTSERPC
jgi:hypothetical protein